MGLVMVFILGQEKPKEKHHPTGSISQWVEVERNDWLNGQNLREEV